LVDTKYEFGKANDGSILLIDEVKCYLWYNIEFSHSLTLIIKCINVLTFLCCQLQVHTPDSSRYWIANSYLERIQNGLEPENVDKVFYVHLCLLHRWWLNCQFGLWM
jgi:phosphoribosylaminoimidazole-succinocarboxamide synthase